MIWKLLRYRRRYRRARQNSLFAKLLRAARWGFYGLMILVMVDAFYLTLTWPDWRKIISGPIPRSKFINDYERTQRTDQSLPPLRWRPVPLTSIPGQVRRAVIVAEDIRFYEHGGFDLIAFKEAMDYNLSAHRFVLGASTISQQTAKNLFLSSSRNPLRKWHELILTWGMEHHLRKHRILEIYLNVAEFGRGIYGVEAASQTYWHKPVSELTLRQSAELAASLPSPKKNNPATRTQRFLRRTQKIMNFMRRFEQASIVSHKKRKRRARP